MKKIPSKISRVTLSWLMILLLLLPFSQIGQVQTVQASGPVTVIGGNGTIQETVSAGANTVTAGSQTTLLFKEITLDGIFHSLAKMVLHNMTQEILNWINSGFQGKPAFVTDLGQFLLDAADDTVGQFIYNDPDLNFLCSPFQLDVKIALATSYQESTYDSFASCSLSEVTDNIEGFLSGAFDEGGWESWFEITQNPINTPTGAFLEAKAEMYARIVDEQGNTLKELDWGDGFLSFKVCSDTAAASGAQKNCTITTPGRVIADQINKSLGAGQDELISADEINEIIAALFAQLAKQAITGIYGMLGLSSGTGYTDTSFANPNGSTTQSYLDAAADEADNADVYLQNNPFTSAITSEHEYQALQQEIVTLIDAVEDQLDSAYSQDEACFDLTMPDDLIRARDLAIQAVAISANTLVTLSTYNAAYLVAATDQERLAATNNYVSLQTAGLIKTAADIGPLQVFVDYTLATDISDFVIEISREVNRCND